MSYHYTLPWVVLDAETVTLITNRGDGILLDENGAEVAATTPLGVPTAIRTNSVGTTVPFSADVPAGRVRFGTVEAAVFADENMNAAARAEAAARSAADALAAIRNIGDTATEMSYVVKDPATGDLIVSDTPVAVSSGGARLRFDALGYLHADFLI